MQVTTRTSVANPTQALTVALVASLRAAGAAHEKRMMPGHVP